MEQVLERCFPPSVFRGCIIFLERSELFMCICFTQEHVLELGGSETPAAHAIVWPATQSRVCCRCESPAPDVRMRGLVTVLTDNSLHPLSVRVHVSASPG
eukprot:3752203-Prymnesium_polylepis.1